MTTAKDRAGALKLIKDAIRCHGRHIYAVAPGEVPRVVYTIGGYEAAGFELVFAGGQIFSRADVVHLLNDLGARLSSPEDATELPEYHPNFGPIRLMPVDSDWTRRLLLGATDYYDRKEIPAFQVVPTDPEYQSIDIPNMSQPFSPDMHPVWTYIDGGWPFPIIPNAVAITDRDAMLGYGLSEVMRWGETEFEVFSGEPPNDPKVLYKVPMSTLLLSDTSLQSALDLRIGNGLIRGFADNGLPEPWQSWAPRT